MNAVNLYNQLKSDHALKIRDKLACRKFKNAVIKLAKKTTATDPEVMILDAIALRIDLDINKYLKGR